MSSKGGIKQQGEDSQLLLGKDGPLGCVFDSLVDAITQSLVIGLTKVLSLVFTVTVRILPFLSGKVFIIRPNCHLDLCCMSSTSSTMSFTSTLACGLNHFCRRLRFGRNSLIHRAQNWLAMYCIWAHRRLP